MKTLTLRKNEERRIFAGHLWIYSNEIDTQLNPLKSYKAGEQVEVLTHGGTSLGSAYINPHSLIAARIYSRNREALSEALLKKRIQDALNLRESLFKSPFYRLIFGEGDYLPGLVIDRFGEHLVVQITTAGMENVKDAIISALLSLLNPKTILWRNDSGSRKMEGLGEYVTAAYGTPPDEIELIENNTRFIAALQSGQKTGWFYDHRMNRLRMKDYAQNRSVLDVFSYLGAWGLTAAQFGATSVTCVDASETACQLIKRNAQLNHASDKVQVICDDAFEALKRLLAEGKSFDVVIVDPPAFIKKQKDFKEGFLAYQRINELALKLTKSGGILASSSCSMHLKDEDLQLALLRAAGKTKCHLQILEYGHQGPDHPVHPAIAETRYIKMLLARKL